MSTLQLIDKQSPVLLSTKHDYYTVAAHADIKPEYFGVATAVSTLLADIEALGGIGDILLPEQVTGLNAAYAALVDEVTT